MTGSKSLILCVDDEKIILDSLEEQIARNLGEKYEIELCQGGEEALEAIEEFEEEGRNIAVIISDQLMPGMKGDEFLIKTHQLLPETLKILLTGQANLEAIRKSINKASLYRYVNKPWEEEDLMLTIEEAALSYERFLQLRELNKLLRALNKATQEISGEMDKGELTEKLMRSALESTGAEKGFLLMRDTPDDPLTLRSVSCIIAEEEKRLVARMRDENEAVSLELLERIDKARLEDKAESFKIFSPLVRQNEEVGFIYLENTLTREVFDENQQEILSMLTAQAIISIDNAELYRSLETKTDELETERDKIAKVNKDIEKKTANITNSIVYAQRIQSSILPHKGELQDYIPSSFVLHKAKDIVSGDFYWWQDLGDKFLIAAVDCTGHGVPGAFMSVIGCNFLNQITMEFGITDPEAVLQYLHVQIKTALKQDQKDSQTRDGMDMALLAFNKKDGTLQYAGAYRPLYQVRDGELIEHVPSKHSIGGLTLDGREPVFEGQLIDLRLGDTFYFFSDGYPDQFGGPKFKKLTQKRFKRQLVQIQEHDMRIQHELVNHNFEKWRGEEEQTDDVIVIGLRYDENAFQKQAEPAAVPA